VGIAPRSPRPRSSGHNELGTAQRAIPARRGRSDEVRSPILPGAGKPRVRLLAR